MKKSLGLLQACELIQSNRLLPQDLLADCASQADACEPTLKAFLERASLDELTRQIHCGPLMGIPVAIKDIIATTDFPTTNGSPIYQGHTPKEDAPIIGKIRALGGVVFGKTVTTEFAWRSPGPTTNPWNSEHTPGGSSSRSSGFTTRTSSRASGSDWQRSTGSSSGTGGRSRSTRRPGRGRRSASPSGPWDRGRPPRVDRPAARAAPRGRIVPWLDGSGRPIIVRLETLRGGGRGGKAGRTR